MYAYMHANSALIQDSTPIVMKAGNLPRAVRPVARHQLQFRRAFQNDRRPAVKFDLRVAGLEYQSAEAAERAGQGRHSGLRPLRARLVRRSTATVSSVGSAAADR